MQSLTLQSNDHWNFDTWFTGFGNADYREFKQNLTSDIEKMRAKAFVLKNNIDEIACILNDFESLKDRLDHLSNYLLCLFADNPNDESIKADKSWMALLHAEATKLNTSLEMSLAHLSEADFQVLLNIPSLKDAEHLLKRMREEGLHKMPLEMEVLAADLNVDGLHAWGRLYETLAGKMTFEMPFPGEKQQTISMSRRRALMADPNRAIRSLAFHHGQKPWNDHAETFGACLNGIAGSRLQLYRHRNILHFLDTPLFDSAMSSSVLDAMLHAIHQHIELPREALRIAAKLQGTPALHYFDLEAPQITPVKQRSLSWEEACATVEKAFSSAYPHLGHYFRDILASRWIEARPSPNKLPGAFCTQSRWKREERVYMSFHGTFHDVVTLAHEVGHAFHSYLLRERRSFASSYPMTLAETASNFGEMILLNSLMSDPTISAEEKACLVDQQMLRAHAYLINIPMRYDFEHAFYTERASGEVPVSRLCQLMTESQMKWYGDTLESNGTDPLFWAYKMHFFITDLSFYNFPYVFGYLLSQALFARFNKEGNPFLSSYEKFLKATGSGSCEEVAQSTLGMDLTQPDFWVEAIDSIQPLLKNYEVLVSRN